MKYLAKEVLTGSGAPAYAWKAKNLIANLWTDICRVTLDGYHSPEAMLEGRPPMGQEVETVDNFTSLESYPTFFNECVFKVCIDPGGFLADAEFSIDNQGRAFLSKSILQPCGSAASCWRAVSVLIDMNSEILTIAFDGYYSQQTFEQGRDPMTKDVKVILSDGFSTFETYPYIYGELVGRIISSHQDLAGATLSEILPSSSSMSMSSSSSSSSSTDPTYSSSSSSSSADPTYSPLSSSSYTGSATSSSSSI